jgi:ATP-dependent DNA helicase RecQ
MLVCLDDLSVLENFVYGDTPDAAAVQGLVGEPFSPGEDCGIGLYALSQEHDVRPLAVRPLLTCLGAPGLAGGGDTLLPPIPADLAVQTDAPSLPPARLALN